MNDDSHVFLAIDDMIENLITIKALIKESFPDSVILTAQSGKDALILAHEHEPDIVLLDIMMPDMDGFEVCRAFKADDVLREIPVVFVTALKNDKQTRIKALESGAEAFLNKPIDEVELLAQLNAMLKIRELNIKKKEAIIRLESDLADRTEKLAESEKHLKANLHKYKILAEKINDVMLLVDLEGNILDVNPSAIKLYGYSYEEFLTMKVSDLRHENDNNKISRQLEGAADEGILFETVHYRKDNTAVDVEVSSRGTMVGDKKLLLSIVRDISDRKKAEQELQNNEKKYRTLFESAQGAILLFTEGRWVDCNEKALKIFGCKREQIIGEHPIRFSPLKQPDGGSSDEEAIKKIDLAYSNEPQLFEWVHCRADGSLFDAEVSLKRVDLGDKIFIQAIVLDISERKKTEDLLRESEAKFKAAFMTGPDAFFWATLPEGKIIEANDRFESIFGYSHDEIIGKTSLELNLYSEAGDRAKMVAELREMGFVRELELQGRRKDGALITVTLSVSMTELFGQIFSLGVIRDITERKRSENALKRAQALNIGIIESTSDMIWTVDTERFGLLSFNHALSDYFLKLGIDLKIGMRPEDMVPSAEFRETWHTFYKRVLHDGSYSLEYDAIDGKTHLLLTFGLLKQDGEVFGISVFGKNITESKLAERALQTSNANLTTILNSSLFGVVTININKEIRWANPAAIKMMGFNSLGDIVNKKCFDYFCPADKNRCPILDEGQTVDNSERSIKRTDGKHIPIIKSVTEIQLDGEFLLLETFIDISALKETEKELRLHEEHLEELINSRTKQLNKEIAVRICIENTLRESEDKYRNLIDLSSSIVLEWDTEGNILYMNKYGLDFFGYSAEDLLGNNVLGTIVETVDTDGFDLENKMKIVEKNPKDFYSSENENMKKNGEKVWIAWTNKEVIDETGNLLKILSVGIDRTIQHRTEKILDEYRDKLEKMVDERTQELKDANTKLLQNEFSLRKIMKQNQRILDNLQDAYFQADLSGIFTTVNPAAVTMYGCKSIDELIGQSTSCLYADSRDREKMLDELRKKGELRDFYCQGLRKDGTCIPVSMNVQFIKKENGEILGTEGVVRDVTERQKAEMAIRVEAERYNALIESTDDWIWVVDSENYQLTLFNNAVADYFKRNHNVILKTGMTPDEMLSENRRDLWKGLYKKAISEGGFSTEYQTVSERLHFILSLAPLIIDGATVGISIFAKNITNESLYKEELELRNQTLSRRLKQTISAISKIGELRDVYTAGHQRRVSELACAIANEMGLSNEVINNLADGALIHDIGKIHIASDILNKPGKITSLEYQILQTHVEQSYDIVKDIDFPDSVKEMIHQHHERMDGTGYPKQLAGDQIIIEGRILAVADVVEAMSSHRPYRPSLGIDKALEEILLFRGEKYDGDVVDVCVSLFREKSFEFTNTK